MKIYKKHLDLTALLMIASAFIYLVVIVIKG